MLLLLTDRQLNQAAAQTAKQMNLNLMGVKYNQYRDFAGEVLVNAMSMIGHEVVIESDFEPDFGDNDWADGYPGDFGDR